MTPTVVIAPGALNRLDDLLRAWNASRLLVVTGRASYGSSGAQSALRTAWSGRTVHHLDQVRPNPQLQDVESAVRTFRQAGPDAIVAVGGGSVIDVAKIANVFAVNDVDPRAWHRGGVNGLERARPLVAIPTTAGTGAEATPFATLYVDGVKRSVESASLRPTAALIDPTLMLSMPPYIAACSAMDALTQSIESYWSVTATSRSRAIARAAIRCIWPTLSAVANGPGAASMWARAKGAYLSGCAIAMTRTTACHAISYPLTSRYGVAMDTPWR